jgi:chemotaxis protein methyltransferase CheR
MNKHKSITSNKIKNENKIDTPLYFQSAAFENSATTNNKHPQNAPSKMLNGMKVELISQFTHLIRERLGIIIHSHQKNDLIKVIENACKKFDLTPEEYFKELNEVPDHSPFIEHLATSITVGETYFFRDSNQMKLLQEFVLPELIKRKRKDENHLLRIWSAGSSSGEEIYTLAMFLCDMLPDINAWNLKLLGTDINTNALKKAIEGIYSDWSMRSTPERYKQRYFTTQNQNYIISKHIRDMVSFQYLNLNNDTFPSILNDTNAQDLILCRNVLIYFDRERGIHLMKKLSACLVPDGYLILGASDPIYTTDTHLIFNYKQGALFTRTTEKEIELKKVVLSPTIKSVSKNDKAIKKLQPKPLTQSKIKTPTIEDQKNIISQLLSESRWQETLNIIASYHEDIAKSAFILCAEATALANLGKLNEAIHACYQSLKLDSTNITAHFTLAMVLTELNHIKEAEVELRKTLFLDHQFVMGHFQLGLLLLKNRQHELGIKCLRNALTIAKTNDPNQLVSGFNKIVYGHLAEILEHELEIHIAAQGISYANKSS